MNTRTVECPVETDGAYGDYANSFRVMQDGPDVILDFCLYSEQEKRAKLVSRIRIPPSFLRVILARLSMATNLESISPGNRLYIMPELKGCN